MNEQQLEAKALERINRGRRALGLRELARVPRADRSDGSCCVTYSAFKDAPGIEYSGATSLTFKGRLGQASARTLNRVWRRGLDHETDICTYVSMPPILCEISNGGDEGLAEDRFAFLHRPGHHEPARLSYAKDAA